MEKIIIMIKLHTSISICNFTCNIEQDAIYSLDLAAI